MRKGFQITLLLFVILPLLVVAVAGVPTSLMSVPEVSWLPLRAPDRAPESAALPGGPGAMAGALDDLPAEVRAVLDAARGQGDGPAYGTLQTAARPWDGTEWEGLLQLAAARRAQHAGRERIALRLTADPDLRASHLGGHARMIAAEVHAVRGDWRSAAGIFAQVAERESGKALEAGARVRAAEAFLEAGMGTQALEEVERLESLVPDLVAEDRVLYLRGLSYAVRGSITRAQETLDALYFQHPTSRWNRRAAELPWRKARAGRLHKAAVPLADRLARADALYDRRSYTSAHREYARILERRGGDADFDLLRLRAGVSAFKRKRYDEALDLLRAVDPARRDLRAQALFYEGQVRRRQKRYAEFLWAMEEAADLDPGGEFAARARLEAGKHLERKAQEGALESFRQAAEAAPGTEAAAEARWRLGWARYMAYDFEAAREEFLHLARDGHHPHERAAGLYWAAKSDLGRGNRKSAVLLLRRVLGEFPNDFYATRAREMLGRPLDETPVSIVPVAGEDSVLEALRGLAGRLAPEEELFQSLRRVRDLAALSDGEGARAELRWLEARVGPGPEIDGIRLELLGQEGRHLKALVAFRGMYPDFRSRLDIPEAHWRAVYPRRFLDLVSSEAGRQGLDTDFVLAVIHQESVFDPGATSHAGARGLMQIMPSTGAVLARRLEEEGYGTPRLYEPDLNVRFGTFYLADLLDRFQGRPELALAGYNAGSGRVDRWTRDGRTDDPDVFVETIPFDETRNYVKRILNNVALYKRLYGEGGGRRP